MLGYPNNSFKEDIILNPDEWLEKDSERLIFTGIEMYQSKEEGSQTEWMGAKIPIPSKFDNHIILFKDDSEFSREDCILLLASLSACTIEIKRIRNLNAVKRKYRKETFERMLDGGMSFEDAKHQVNLLGYSVCEKGSIMVMNLKSNGLDVDSEVFVRSLSNIFEEVFGCIPLWVPFDDCKIIVYLGEYDQAQIQKIFSKLSSNSLMGEMIFAIGREADFSEIGVSYKEARKSLIIGERVSGIQKILYFKDLGFYRFINLPEDESEIIKYYDDYIKPIEEQFPDEYLDEILETLGCYIESRFNYMETAKIMHVHRNTVRYRIKAIERLCNIDLQSKRHRLNVELALELLPLIDRSKSEA